MTVSDKRLLTPAQAAELLGVAPDTLAQWRSQRRGPPYIKLEGRLVRYRNSDLERYLRERTEGCEFDISSAGHYTALPEREIT